MTTLQYKTSKTAEALAQRIIEGAASLAIFVEGLSNSEWKLPVVGDGRSIGVVVHHVASTYPLEIELARVLAKGEPIKEATMEVVDKMNADHAKENEDVSMQEALDLLERNSRTAADSVKEFSDEELKNSATVSLNANAPLTAQFFIEDHALRHSYHHLERIKETLETKN